MSVCYKIEARSLTVFDQPKWPLSHMCICVISLRTMRLSCHWVLTHLLQDYKIEACRRSLIAIFVDQVSFTKMTSYSLLLYLLQAFISSIIINRFMSKYYYRLAQKLYELTQQHWTEALLHSQIYVKRKIDAAQFLGLAWGGVMRN